MTVNPGYTGTLNTSVDGLVAAAVATRNTPKPTNTTVDVMIPAGTTYARFATYDADYPAGTDLDLVVQRVTATGVVAVGTSGGSTSEEAVNVTSPVAGTYRVTIDYFAGATETLDVKLNSFALDGTSKGNLTVTPASASVTTGTPVSLTAAWTGLDGRDSLPGSRQLQRRHRSARQDAGQHPALTHRWSRGPGPPQGGPGPRHCPNERTDARTRQPRRPTGCRSASRSAGRPGGRSGPPCRWPGTAGSRGPRPGRPGPRRRRR